MHNALESVLKYYEVSNHQLCVGGRPVSEIAAETGTPLYLYDLNVARKKFEMLRAAISGEVDIHYAIKANPHPEVISFFKGLGCGADVASLGELNRALEAGIPVEDIGFAGPGKSRQELEAACRAGIGSLNAESEQELEMANEVAGEVGCKLNIALRINPAFELVASGMRMGGGPKAFGIDQEEIPRVLKKFKEWPNLNFVGFHLFAGSQNLNHDSISDAMRKAFEVFESLLPDCPKPPRFINLGGGFGIPYFAADEELDIYSVGMCLKQLLQTKKEKFSDTKFVVEAGRYLIGEAGLYIAQVQYVKQSRGETFLVLNGGMNHQLAASGNLGQIIKKSYPMALTDRIGCSVTQSCHVVGPLCTPIDSFGKKIELPEVAPTDLLAVFCSGAYGLSSSPLLFLGHEEPRECVFK